MFFVSCIRKNLAENIENLHRKASMIKFCVNTKFNKVKFKKWCIPKKKSKSARCNFRYRSTSMAFSPEDNISN